MFSLEVTWCQNFELYHLFTLKHKRTQSIVSCMWDHSHLYFHLREKYEWWMGASASEEDSVWAPLGPPHGRMGSHPLGPVKSILFKNILDKSNSLVNLHVSAPHFGACLPEISGRRLLYLVNMFINKMDFSVQNLYV